MKKSVLLLLLSALFTCGSVYAQLRVTGTVLDAATGEPMAGASVIEQGTTSGTTTDTKGRFARLMAGSEWFSSKTASYYASVNVGLSF